MDYIVFDLEWNQCPYGKSQENEKLPFEIIEIGAVRMNENKEILDTFHTYVKPVVYRKIHFRTQQVIGLSMEDLRHGKRFVDAAREFLDFCGDDYRFCTWGSLDLFELLRNLKYYGMDDILEAPLFYDDVQKLFALTYETKNDRRALSYAADFLKLSRDGDFHHALDDAMYTARVLATIPDEIIRENYSVDYFKVPQTKDAELSIHYKTYTKFISRPFDLKEELVQDRRISAVHCFACNRIVRKKVRWFSLNSRVYISVGQCPDHGLVQSKLRVKKSEDGRVFAVKTTKLIDEEKLAEIRRHQAEVRKKRREKRKH
ncbi:MAG: 3'-5' exonuclease [Lachnospiraceae bacterium]|nr:3'-5' exonuclease [Lachnospiraceae bacterium]